MKLETDSDQRRTGHRRLAPQESWPEDLRLQALYSLRILDTPPEPSFDRVVTLARRLFRVPMVAVSLIDRDRQWFKASCGLSTGETARSVSFCTHTLAAQEPVFCVPDATCDPLFASNPMVTGDPGIRFYAGAVLRAPGGAPVGALCLIDLKPRAALDEGDRQALMDLAAIASDELALRAAALTSQRQVEQLEKTGRALQSANDALKRLNDRHRADVAAAMTVQAGNLPSSPARLPPLTIASLHIPSRDLSGDMYGYGRLDASASYVWLGDVAGHGIEAALRAVTMSKIVSNNLKPGGGYRPPREPAAFLRQVNDMMQWPDESALSYCTLLYGLYDEAAQAMRLAFAGAPWPLLLVPGEAPRYIEGSGLPLGLFPEAAHDEMEIPLPPGARLLLFSDGLADLRDRGERSFSERRVAEWMAETRDTPSPRALALLRDRLDDWCAGRAPDDDVAVVLIERDKGDTAR